jgi:hypothetical protein
MRLIKLLCFVFAAIILVSASALPTEAQTVFGTGTPASCVQNAPNTDLACGSGSVASPGTGTTAVGINAKANGDAATAFGAGATATSISATSFGQGAAASATGAIAIGQGASATGSSAIGIGFAGRGLAARAIGIGEVATATGSDSTAIGANTSAGFSLSTALGANAQATAANQMMFGTATNILAAPGLVSAASKAAQKGKVLMVTVDANGNLATAAVPAVCPCRPVPPIRTPIRPKR